jgi:hypothetical protein
VVNWILAGCSIIAFSFVTNSMTSPWVMMFIYMGVTFVLTIVFAVLSINIKGLSVRKVQIQLQWLSASYLNLPIWLILYNITIHLNFHPQFHSKMQFTYKQKKVNFSNLCLSKGVIWFWNNIIGLNYLLLCMWYQETFIINVKLCDKDYFFTWALYFLFQRWR